MVSVQGSGIQDFGGYQGLVFSVIGFRFQVRVYGLGGGEGLTVKGFKFLVL